MQEFREKVHKCDNYVDRENLTNSESHTEILCVEPVLRTLRTKDWFRSRLRSTLLKLPNVDSS